MSDKSFGDNTNRNIVKNPLLSTAVTGLSLEDLTHNAVLFPVPLNQKAFPRKDPQSKPETLILRHSDHANANFQSGDADSHQPYSAITKTHPQPTPHTQQSLNTDKGRNTCITESKALSKSTDDFDVNEYFARLQGTRYVSAPINLPKDGANTNLEDQEQHLEEINLNEPEKSNLDIVNQHSITADIAQNFSQLPTVIPQVASAVFSSFSNMLSMKSREVTPEDRSVAQAPGYQNVQRNDEVQLGVPDFGNREVAPPPREPPITGTASYRITSKKKYAQIPGLMSAPHAPIYNPMTQPENTPSYFIPSPGHIPPNNELHQSFDVTKPIDSRLSLPAAQNTMAEVIKPLNSEIQNNNDASKKANAQVDKIEKKFVVCPDEGSNNRQLTNQAYSIYNPAARDNNISVHVQAEERTIAQLSPFYNPQELIKQETILPSQTHDVANDQRNLPPPPQFSTANTSAGLVLPPPPTFANLPPRETQSSAGRSYLPLSVARRLAGNQPVIKTATPLIGNLGQNNFVPSPVFDASLDSNTQSDKPSESNRPPSAFAQFNASSSQGSDYQLTANVHLSCHSGLPSSTLSSKIPIHTSMELPMPPSSNMHFVGLPPTSLRSPISAPIDAPMNVGPKEIVTSQILTPSMINTSEVKTELQQLAPDILLFPVKNLTGTINPPSIFTPTVTPNIQTTISTLRQTPGPITQTVSRNNNENSHLSDPNSSQHLEQAALKPVPEPPKKTGNQTFRLAKKKPQYYAGPIEGIGSISNNVKPIIAPLETTSIVGEIYTPVPSNIQENVEIIQSNLDQSTAPFDINRPVANVAEYPACDVNKAQPNIQPNYNTSFDMSRQTTDLYESPKQESLGFGIIGSLKSKLGSLDINKLQNTVTTFFDPAYNEAKDDKTILQDSKPYEPLYGQNYGQLQSNFEIFVPNVDTSQYQYDYQTQNVYQPQFNRTVDEFNYYQNHNQNAYPSYYFQEKNQPENSSSTNIQASYYSTSYNTNTDNTPAQFSNVNLHADNVKVFYQSLTSYPKDDIVRHNIEPSVEVNATNENNDLFTSNTANTSSVVTQTNESTVQLSQTTVESQTSENIADCLTKTEKEYITSSLRLNKEINLCKSENSFALFEIPKPDSETKELLLACENKPQESMFSNLAIDVKEKVILTSSENSTQASTSSSFESQQVMQDNPPFNSAVDKQENLQESLLAKYPLKSKTQKIDVDNIMQESSLKNFSRSPNDEPVTFVGPLKEEDTPITNSISNTETTPLFELSTMLAEKSKELADLEHETSKSSIQEIDTIFNRNANVSFFDNLQSEKPLDDEVPRDLNICVMCREVSKDEIEVNDLTSQLIENITAPIQLTNPVEAPLPENNMTIAEDLTDFDSTQCAEISRITEETIETIQIQSATELLNDDNINTRHYGWNTDDSSFTTRVIPDYDFNLVNNPNPIGFFCNSAIKENIPANASDEIKAELILSDESPIVLPRQITIPTAPPPEGDLKLDETGIDVHSIEQDATQDFLYEEFVVEPSETDEDKKEDRVQKSVDIQDVDSFASRVEKFKKMEEISTDHSMNIQNTKSPSLPIASYFDTGNYAIEAHYRNSLTTLPNVESITLPQIAVPPGFENEYKWESQDHTEKPIIFASETFTRLTTLPLLTDDESEDVALSTATLMAESLLESTTPEKEKLPGSVNIFGAKSNQQTIPNVPIFSTLDQLGPYANLPETNTVYPQEKIEKVQFSSHFSNLFGDKKEDIQVKSLHSPRTEEVKDHTQNLPAQPKLPDPINFFSTGTSTSEPKSENTSVNRLASYFASPAKTEPQKSFFELSQGQDHYRHNKYIDSNNTTKPFFDKSDLENIPAERYLANLNLMETLTSFDNLVLSTDLTVKQVNYFTVELDNKQVNLITNTMDCLETKTDHNSTDVSLDYNINNDEAMSTVDSCKYCCNHTKSDFAFGQFENVNILSIGNFKVTKCMNADTSKNNKKEGNMEEVNRSDKSQSVTVHFEDVQDEDNYEQTTLLSENRTSTVYDPVQHHWFYRCNVDDKCTWKGFSAMDNKALEEAFNSPSLNDSTVVATDGGRYDVNIKGRLRVPVYWAENPAIVRRCSWFYKGATDARYVPYTEEVAIMLEVEYRHGVTTGEWHRRLLLPNSELVVMHGPGVMVHFLQASTEALSPPPQSTLRPRVVRRGHDESEIEDIEPSHIDHLLLMCHGVGSACDMRFRSVEEVVDDFRATSLQLVQSHYKNSFEKGIVGRVEVLPISWHATLHSGELGVDRRLALITLDSIPRLRNFTNDTVLDVLFYTSPVFCQTILETVCGEINRIYKLFRTRNPEFNGGVSLGGHSLGSVILYDLLCHQMPKSQIPVSCENHKSYIKGPSAGLGMPSVKYPVLDFSPVALYALGSPIAIFETIRGVDTLGAKFALPTCRHFFNIFHPYDPIAYRIEPLINPQLRTFKPFLIPHHKGRKRMHLELKDTMARVGSDIKQKLVESIKATWSSMWGYTTAVDTSQLEKVVEEEFEKEELKLEEEKEDNKATEATPELLGDLNKGRRIDYVLQEAPFEMINEYLFAMSSHVCYWESEDTMLLMLREIYDSLGVSPDSTVPQQNMSVRVVRTGKVFANDHNAIFADNSEIPSTSRVDT